MNELLQLAVNAHGRMDRWNRLATILASMSITGAIWQVKGRPEVLRNITVSASLHEEKIITHYRDEDRRAIFRPREIISAWEEGKFEQRANPRESFNGHSLNTPWDDIQVAYFQGEALWTYLTTPFLYTYPGFVVTEMEPWEEQGETWRRLKILFPENISSHTREQISCFGPDGLLRRHEYTVDILGGATGVNYAMDYKEFDGIMVPTTRRIYSYDEKKQKIPEPLLVAIDIGELSFA